MGAELQDHLILDEEGNRIAIETMRDIDRRVTAAVGAIAAAAAVGTDTPTLAKRVAKS